MSNDPVQSPQSLLKVARWIIRIFFFLGFPFLLIDFAGQYELQVQEKALADERFAALDKTLIRYQPFALPEYFLKRWLTETARKAEASGTPLPELERRLRQVETRFPDLFTFTVFDGSDEMIERPGTPQKRRVSELLLATLRDFFGGQVNDEELRRHQSVFKPFLGFRQRMLSFQGGSGWLETSHRPTNTWFFYFIGRKFSLFANVHQAGYRPMMAFRGLLSRDRPDGTRLNLIDMNTLTVTGRGNPVWHETLKRLAIAHERESGNHFQEADRRCSFLALDARFRLIASEPTTAEHGLRQYLTLFRITALTLFLVVLGFSALRNYDSKYYISIRWKLPALFLYSTGLPLIVLGIIGSIYLQEHRRGLTQDLIEKIREKLLSFDNHLTVASRICQNELNRLLQSFRLDTPEGIARMRKTMTAYKSRRKCQTVIVIDAKGREIPIDPRHTPSKEDRNDIFKALIVGTLRELGGEPTENVDSGLAQVDIVAKALSQQSADDLIDSIVGLQGTVYPQIVGLSNGFNYVNVTQAADRRPSHMFLIGWSLEEFLEGYLEMMIPFKPLEDGSEWLALNTRPRWDFIGGGRYPDRTPLVARETYVKYPDRPLSRSLNAFIESVRRINTFSTTTVRYKGQNCLVGALPGIQLKGVLVVVIQPLESIERAI
ncbi:MAG TPA: hypothetical protein PKM25_09775, partial [Candidatus Ozemobacteraceae bacterium]|nr:hypothetical protein [Candidatus Ozemobacteraceae bacterium]